MKEYSIADDKDLNSKANETLVIAFICLLMLIFIAYMLYVFIEINLVFGTILTLFIVSSVVLFARKQLKKYRAFLRGV